ncbi:MAG: hypothetical protein R3C05_03210 [Pirellulaceae bacterium]
MNRYPSRCHCRDQVGVIESVEKTEKASFDRFPPKLVASAKVSRRHDMIDAMIDRTSQQCRPSPFTDASDKNRNVRRLVVDGFPRSGLIALDGVS